MTVEFASIELVKMLLRKLKKSKYQLSSDTTDFTNYAFITPNTAMALTLGVPGAESIDFTLMAKVQPSSSGVWILLRKISHVLT